MRWRCSKRLAYKVANIYAKESEKRRQRHGQTTMINMKRNIATTKVFIEIPSELGYITCIGIIGIYNCCDSIW